MDGLRRCSICGEWMTMQIGYVNGNPHIDYICPNGCQTASCSYVTSTTAKIRTFRYCSQKQCMCENANDHGYCQFSACTYGDVLNRAKSKVYYNFRRDIK